MAATTNLTAVLPTDIALSLSAPTIGTEADAQDVQVGEQTLLNNFKMIKNGSPTVTGAWTFTDADGAPGTAAITATGNASAAIIATGHGNGQGVLAQGAGNGSGVEGVGGGGANGHGGLFIGGAGGADAVVGQADTTAGNNGNGGNFTGHGTGDGVIGQGGANGNGGTFTGGATSGHGLNGVSQDVNSAAVKATAATGGVALWAAGGMVQLDTTSGGDPKGPGHFFADMVTIAEGVIDMTAAGAISFAKQYGCDPAGLGVGAAGGIHYISVAFYTDNRPATTGYTIQLQGTVNIVTGGGAIFQPHVIWDFSGAPTLDPQLDQFHFAVEGRVPGGVNTWVNLAAPGNDFRIYFRVGLATA